MPIPVINTTQSVLGFRQYEYWEFQPAATNFPFRWEAMGLPPGSSLEVYSALPVTGNESTDVLTVAGNTFADNDPVYLELLTGGSGLFADRIYYVREKSGDGFKLSLTAGGTAIDFTTALTAGTIRKVSSGKISGPSAAPHGPFVTTLIAYNADGASEPQTFTFAFQPASGAPDDDALDLYWDVASGVISLADSAGAPARASDGEIEAPIFEAKVRDKRLFRVHLRKDGLPVSLVLTSLRVTAKEFSDDPPESEVVLNDDFESPDGASYFHVVVDFGRDPMKAVISNYDESFIGKLEIEARREIVFKEATVELVNTSRSIPVQFSVDLDGQ